MQTPWTWWRLWHQLREVTFDVDLDLSSAYGLTFSPTAAGRTATSPKTGSEAILHEVFHAFLLSRDVTPSHLVGDIIRSLPDELSDENELQTLAAELVFTEHLGLKLDLQRLVVYAYDNLLGPWTHAEALQAVREARAAHPVLAAVNRALALLDEQPLHRVRESEHVTNTSGTSCSDLRE